MDDFAAKAMASAAKGCPDITWNPKEKPVRLAEAIAGCLLKAVAATSSDMLVKRVQEAVRVIIAYAEAGGPTLRNAMPEAVKTLLGVVPEETLFPTSLKNALAAATDTTAKTVFNKAPACIRDGQLRGTPLARYVEQVAGCLIGITTESQDVARLETLRGSLDLLATIAFEGSPTLQNRYAEVLAKLGSGLSLPANLVQALTFTQRTSAFANKVRNECLKLKAATPSEAQNVVRCVTQAADYANKIQPPDVCKGKYGILLRDCCVTNSNRSLPSCAQHRTSCPTGENWSGTACVRIVCGAGMIPGPDGKCIPLPCPAGMIRDATGQCALGCPPGTMRNAFGQCEQVSCPTPDSTIDSLGRCVSSFCPPGTALNAFGRCQGGNCLPGQAPDPWGRCVPAPCPPGSTIDPSGRCTQISCPVGMMVDPTGRCIPPTVPGMIGMPPGTMPVVPGMQPGQPGQPVQPTCPYGTVPDPFGRGCVPAQ
jgi:hypothetical protein